MQVELIEVLYVCNFVFDVFNWYYECMSQDLDLNLNIIIYIYIYIYIYNLNIIICSCKLLYFCLMHSLMMVRETLKHVAGSYLINVFCVRPIQ